MGSRPLTTAEAIEYAVDPRNDNGEPNQLHVMAFSYDSDCPNYADHIGAIIENPKGWFDGDGFVKEEADAKLYATEAEAQLVATGLNMAPSYSGSTVVVGPCRCYDGILPDDVETFTEDGVVDAEGFGEWGPFFLAFEVEPGPPRGFTPSEALDRVASYVGIIEFTPSSVDRALDALAAFIKQVEDHGSTDLEWGEPGDCQDRIDNDPDENDGRHYGDPHCIWCLQAS